MTNKYEKLTKNLKLNPSNLVTICQGNAGNRLHHWGRLMEKLED